MTDRQLKRVALNFRKGLLGNRPSRFMCAAVCWPLAGFLSAYGIEAVAEEVEFPQALQGCSNHIWLRLPDGRILDPTADQFGLEPIYLGPVPDLYLEAIAGPESPRSTK